MKTLFKTILLLLITSVSCYAQRHRIITKSFDVDKNTSIVLNLDNIAVAFEESTDGKIHFDYIMEFDGYSKKQMKSVIDNVSVEVNGSDNHVSLQAESKSLVGLETFQFDTPHGITMNDTYRKPKLDTIVRKAKSYLINEIRSKNRGRIKNPLKYINERFKILDENGKLKNITKGSFNLMRSEFVIKLPPFVKITINAKASNLYFRSDIQNELSITSKDGSIKAKSIVNPYNKIKIYNASLEAESIIGGDYTFKNVNSSKIGEINQVKINSEFSDVEIGEIGKETSITDFNSEYWFYNWSNDFERFNLYSEYSKIHMFYPKTNHSMKVIGNNTKSLIGNNEFEINMQPTSKGEKYTMMTKEPHPGRTISGQIFFDIIHGIIYTHEDSIKKINN